MKSSATSMDATIYKSFSLSNKKSNFKMYNTPSLTSYHNQIKKSKIKNPYISSASSFFVDLLRQTQFKKENRISYEKNYYINLLKIKLKKKPEILPKLKTLSSTNTFPISIDNINSLTNINFLKNFEKNMKTFSYRNINNKRKNALYKRIIDGQPTNLKSVYVHKILSSNNESGAKEGDKQYYNNINEPEYQPSIIIQTKTMNNDYNLNKSKMKFMIYHGKNKAIKNISNSVEKDIVRKYEGINNTRIKQLFLKKKLIKVCNKMKSVQKDVDNTKNKLNNLFTTLHKDIQFNLDEEYSKDLL
jgi:hypothetical protein